MPAKPWNDLLNGKAERMHCIQKNFLTPNPVVDGVEDCLYLNIYRPMVSELSPWTFRFIYYKLFVSIECLQNTSRKNNSSLPVMVYIHEGGFFAGSISTLLRGPQYFMDAQQVILVLMTYRLGVLGR